MSDTVWVINCNEGIYEPILVTEEEYIAHSLEFRTAPTIYPNKGLAQADCNRLNKKEEL